jgi:membrane protein implicated in regulation of membrane protease activity
MSYVWLIWLLIAAVLIAAEVMTTGFVLLWFGVGALVAAALALIGVSSIAVQMIVFLIVSVMLVIASRTIFERLLKPASPTGELKTGVDQMIGQIGVVVEPSRGALNEGAVRVYGSVWTAFPVAGQPPLETGQSVRVERIEGNAIYVERVLHPAPLFGKTNQAE